MSVDENLMCSFQILRPSTQKSMQDTQTKGTMAHTPNSKSSSSTKTSNVKKWKKKLLIYLDEIKEDFNFSIFWAFY